MAKKKALKKTRMFGARRFERARIKPYTAAEAKKKAASVSKTRFCRVTDVAGGKMVWVGRLKKKASNPGSLKTLSNPCRKKKKRKMPARNADGTFKSKKRRSSKRRKR